MPCGWWGQDSSRYCPCLWQQAVRHHYDEWVQGGKRERGGAQEGDRSKEVRVVRNRLMWLACLPSESKVMSGLWPRASFGPSSEAAEGAWVSIFGFCCHWVLCSLGWYLGPSWYSRAILPQGPCRSEWPELQPLWFQAPAAAEDHVWVHGCLGSRPQLMTMVMTKNCALLGSW